jgi:hypothetical protein
MAESRLVLCGEINPNAEITPNAVSVNPPRVRLRSGDRLVETLLDDLDLDLDFELEVFFLVVLAIILYS